MIRYDLVAQSYFFWPDGQFYHGTPPNGLRSLDRTALIAAGNTDFGVYRQTGSRVMLAFADGDRRDLTVPGTALTSDEVTLQPTPPMPDGSRIKGTIASFFYTGFTPGAGIDGGISSSSSTTFLLDGTYAGESFGGGSGTFDLGGGFATGSTENTGGQYEVRDGLITLFPAVGGASSGQIIVNTAQGIMIGNQFLDSIP